jgi:hypothetical protein
VTRTYLVEMPKAEARHLAGTGCGWPASPESRIVAGLRDWLHGLAGRRSETVPVGKVLDDLTSLLELATTAGKPVRGPFGPGRGGPSLPGHAEYLGGGVVRLDEVAISALAGLVEGEDFRAVLTTAGPVLLVGTDNYLAREEQPGPAPPPPAAP